MDKKAIRFHCPKAGMEKEERIKAIFETIEEWIYSDSLRNLIVLYDGYIPENLGLRDYITWLNDFVNIWDFRKRQSDGGERWTIKDDDKNSAHQNAIMDAAFELGLTESGLPRIAPDYIMPLGGARASNLMRTQYAREVTDNLGKADFSVVALSGKRPVNEIELPYLAEYAPDAKTEYDAINAGLERAFGLTKTEYSERIKMTENVNQRWAVREYTEQYLRHRIYSVAAPSSDPARRANSLDTFEFFMKTFRVLPGQKLLLVTSSIYVPFQFLKFIPLSIEHDIEVDCIGVTADKKGSQFSNASNYLQEIKGTVNAINNLAEQYL